MTSEAPASMSVKARAQKIEARSAAKGLFPKSPPPVPPRDFPSNLKFSTDEHKRINSNESTSPRRCSEGDLFLRCKPRMPAPCVSTKTRQVSLEQSLPRTVPERRATAPLSSVHENSGGNNNNETTSKFTSATSSGVMCGVEETADANFSRSLLFSASKEKKESSSTLDDIITTFEKICDEFTLPESQVQPSLEINRRHSTSDRRLESRENDDVFEKISNAPISNQSFRIDHSDSRFQRYSFDCESSRTASCYSQFSVSNSDPPLKCETFTNSFKHARSLKQPHHFVDEPEPVIYRSSQRFSPRISDRTTASDGRSQLFSSVDSSFKSIDCTVFSYPTLGKENTNINASSSTNLKNIQTVRRKLENKNLEYKPTSYENNIPPTCQTKTKCQHIILQTTNSFSKTCDSRQEVCNVKPDECNDVIDQPRTFYSKVCSLPTARPVSGVEIILEKCSKSLNPNLSRGLLTTDKTISNIEILRIGEDIQFETNRGRSSSEELRKVKDILDKFDFKKYRRQSLETDRKMSDREGTSPRVYKPQKSNSERFKDFFELLKPNSEESSPIKRPFCLLRSSSFTNAAFLSEECESSDLVTNNTVEYSEHAKKVSTLPRRKSPAHHLIGNLSSPKAMPAVNSCPSIVKFEPQKLTVNDIRGTDIITDDGLVPDSEAGPGNYMTEYVNCVKTSTFSSGRSSHFRSSSDTSTTSTLLPDLRIQKTNSVERLWTSMSNRLNEIDKRKQGKQDVSNFNNRSSPGVSEVKSGTGRSLTYPPQRKSISEKEEEYSSIDSNGLKSLKKLTKDLMGSGTDGFRLLSYLSLADSHLTYSEDTTEETYQDITDSVLHSSANSHRLCVSESNSNKPHKKKHHSDPGGEACSPSSSEDFITDTIGSSRSEPDLVGQEVITLPSTCSSESSERYFRSHPGLNLGQHQEDSANLQLKLVIDGQVPITLHSGRKHGLGPSGSFTSDATPYSRFQFPDVDSSGQRLAIEQIQASKSPQEQRRYSKRRLRGPYGEMLEEEMRKSGEKQKSAFSDLSFLQELTEPRSKSQESTSANNASAQSVNRPAMFLSSQSLDDATSTSSKNELSMCVTPKRKISANYPLLVESEPVAIASDEDISPIRPQDSLEGDYAKISEVVETKNLKLSFKDSVKEVSPIQDRQPDTRTHVVTEIYETEKSYVDSLQVLVNKYMKVLKSPDYTGIIDSGIVDEIFFQIPEILNIHEDFLDVLTQRYNDWDVKNTVGDLFVEAFTKQQVIDTYTSYINNWKSAKEATKVTTLAKPAFARFLEHMSREHKGKLALDALLIMPVQRIPRYELLIKELLKHTNIDHPDHHLLIQAQKEVHDLAVKINRVEREAFQQELMQQKVREIEQYIEGLVDLVQSEREFIRHDIVTIPGSLGTKKERCLFLFSDSLVITTIKKKGTTMRKPSSAAVAPSPSCQNSNVLEMNKYKYLTRFPLDSLDISKSTNINLRRTLKDIKHLEEDILLLKEITDLISKLNTHHQSLEDAVKELSTGISKQLLEKQTNDLPLICLELTVTTSERAENLVIHFPSPERKALWEATFNEAKQKLASSTGRRPPPEFLIPLPIRKTRAGLQFTCASATPSGINQQGLKDVWVCNSDGYVGQVCVLSLLPEPTVMSCNGICNTRILTITSAPAPCPTLADKNRWRPILPEKESIDNIEVEEIEEECVDMDDNNGNIQLDSDTSDEDDDESTSTEEKHDEIRKRSTSIPKEDDIIQDTNQEDDNNQPTMWLGTQDGCILVYNSYDNIRTKKHKYKFQLESSIQCIIYLDNKVFVTVVTGEIYIYKRELGIGWFSNDPPYINVGNKNSTVTKMLAVTGKLWCACENVIHVLNTTTIQEEHSFPVCNDITQSIHCMVTSGLGVWLILQHSAVIKLFHATTYAPLLDVNVSSAVSKTLSDTDDIIKQHKSACLRVTALLASKDMLWAGTSAGVILTFPLPHLTSSTTAVEDSPIISGLSHGHTGHVRFLTCVEMTPGYILEQVGFQKYMFRLVKNRESGRRASTSAASTVCKLLVISGGDGYENFHQSGLGETAGRDDSTNHLLLWQV